MKFQFSKGESTLKRSQDRLMKSIAHEYEHEEEESGASQTEIDNKISDFIQTNGWTFNIEQTSTRVTMEKSVGDLKVKVMSSIKAANPEEDEGSEDKNNEEENENEDEEKMNPDDKYIDFIVQIDRSGKTESLIFDIFSYEGEIIINNFYTSSDAEGLVNNRMRYLQTETYSGPQFESLDDKVQTSTANFLKTLGIDSTLSTFLEEVCQDLEQRYYMAWLHDIKTFLE
jgi:complement component 1 Q subcomponent-binding protein